MRKLRFLVFAVLLSFPGCLLTPLAPLVEDINGIDLSACLESSCGRETCWQLLKDNYELFGGQLGLSSLHDSLFDTSKSLQ